MKYIEYIGCNNLRAVSEIKLSSSKIQTFPWLISSNFCKIEQEYIGCNN